MLLDSNILIYASSSKHAELRRFVEEHMPSVSIITKVETLGYYRLGPAERIHLESFFQEALVLMMTDEIADRAIILRQQRNMSLGDSLIAATALVHGMAIVTHNVTDFDWIPDLEIIDPLELPE